ncbi:MAG: acyl-CoA dehydrogenase C-terminal domain-containing protein [Pseudomonadota bacterium]
MGAASFNFLMYSGYVCLAYFWALSAAAAETRLTEERLDADFCSAKLQSARFYFEQILPRARGCAAAIKAGGESMMSLDEAEFAF